MSEWFKEPVLKTGDSERNRGFKSYFLRQAEAEITTESKRQSCLTTAEKPCVCFTSSGRISGVHFFSNVFGNQVKNMQTVG